MISFMTKPAVHARRTAAVIALAMLPALGCSTDEALTVTDPDIINLGRAPHGSMLG